MSSDAPYSERAPTDDEIQFVFDQRDRAEPAEADRLDDAIDRMLRKQFSRRQQAKKRGENSPTPNGGAWIPLVGSDVPTESEPVFARWWSGYGVAIYQKGKWWDDACDKEYSAPTHWMPIPEPSSPPQR